MYVCANLMGPGRHIRWRDDTTGHDLDSTERVCEGRKNIVSAASVVTLIVATQSLHDNDCSDRHVRRQ